MGQAEIYEILKANPGKKFTTKELFGRLSNTNRGSIQRAIRKMRKLEEISFLEKSTNEYVYWYNENA